MKKKIEKFINNEIIIEFNTDFFNDSDYYKKYNNRIRNELPSNKHGVYIWKIDNVIVYIGKGGSITRNGNPTEHSVKNRLVASRYQDKKTKKYITTGHYLKKLLLEKKWKQISIIVYFPKKNIPVAYIESLLLFHYYKENGRLPLLNKRY